MDEPVLPGGVVTFLLTDVQDSTDHWSRPGAATSMARQRHLIAVAVASHGGVQPLEQGEGDSTVAAFIEPGDALAAARDIQRALGREAWPEGTVAVRIGVHTGIATLVDDRTYGGQVVIRCARLRDLAHGGQVLVSSSTAAIAQDSLPDGVTLRELSTVRLKGLDRPERAHQLEHPDLRTSFPPLHGHEPPPELPSFPTIFMGRERELDQLRGLLHTSRLLTVTGAGGSGKTRVAHTLATRSADDYADGVVWVDLCRVGEDARVASEAAAACGLAESPGGVDAATMVTLHLSSHHRLLVLDNCEHVLDGAAALAESILARSGASTIVATTREPLGVSGETVWRIPSLDVPDDGTDLVAARAASAVALFADRARSASPDFVVDHATVDHVTTICRRLDGIPLAIELAAARLRTMSLADLTTALDDRFRLLAAGPRTLERQRTLMASIDWSHDLLDPDERQLLRRLGVFASPFGVAAAEAVGAHGDIDRLAVFDLLARLVDKSLVQHDERGYSMLETIRQYALQKAVDANEVEGMRRRHLDWFVAQLAAWGFEGGPVTMDVFDEADRVLPDLRAAFEWALEIDRVKAARLLHALTSLVGFRGGYRELDELTRRACAHEAPGSATWAALLAPTVHVLPLALTDWWIAPAEVALEDPSAPAAVRRRLVWILNHLDLLVGTLGVADRLEALIIEARADDDHQFEAAGAMLLALAATVNGNLARAEPYLAWGERRYPCHVVTPLLHSARTFMLVARGELSAALDTTLDRPTWGNRVPISYVGDILAAALSRSRPQLAALEAEIAACEFSGASELVLMDMKLWAAAADGDLEAMANAIDDALDAAHTIGHRSTVLGERAQIALAIGEIERAGIDTREALDLAADVDQPLASSFAGLTAAWVDHATGDLDLAQDKAHRALDLAEGDRLRWCSIQLLELLALVASDQGDLDRAGRVLGACDAFRERHRFLFAWPYPTKQMNDLRERLDPASVAEGRTMSIDDAVAYARGNRGERARPSFGWEALTPTERRVVDLVADGLSNKQIAEKLFIGVPTVKTHLVHIYPKLGLSSRAELIAAAVSRANARP